MDTIGKRIATLRVRMNMTQMDLAKKLFTSRAVVAKWENDEKRSVPNEYLIALADVFEVSTDYLLGRTKAKKPENINVVDKYGLSEKALSKLEYCYSNQKKNSITLAVSALLEDGSVLHSISKYLYYTLRGNAIYGGMVPYRMVYKYHNSNDFWKERADPFVDADVDVDAIDNDMCKRIIMLEIQENLKRLLDIENLKKYFLDEG